MILKSWSVQNFKAIGASGELQLAPITVLAGLNSSGKTSFLQSILMIAQTLGSRLVDRPLLPNERIIQLGTFEDVLASFSLTRALHIHFEIALVNEKEEDIPYDEEGLASFSVVRRELYTVKVHVTFRSPHQGGIDSSAIDASNVFVEDARLDLTYENASISPRSEPTHDTFAYHAMTGDELTLFLQQVKPEARRLASSSSGQPSYFGTFVPTERYPSPSSYLLTLSHFFPARLIRKFKERERIEREIGLDLTLMFAFNRAPGAHLRQVALSTPLSEQLQAAIRRLCQHYDLSPPFEGSSLMDLEAWSAVLREKDYETGELVASDLVTLAKQYLLSQRPDEHAEFLTPISDSYNEQVGRLMHAIDHVTTFFSRNIRYLGPLRVDPGTVQQQFAPTGNLDEVGAKGEYSAMVYHYNQQATLTYYHPVRGGIEQATLQEALDTWARYLGVAHQVRTDIAGVTGMTWKVFLKPDTPPRSLSQVGVGTSQILPLLVMGLLSPKQSLLVIEQPELHLHSRVQSRLGDFFIGLAKCQKQCLIETHSENLVNQLRYHIVRSGGQDDSGCAIYFVQQDEQGTTTFDPIRISARGNIVNWPDGFFDETLLQQEQITEEHLRQEVEQSDHKQHPSTPSRK